ncbi:cysteine methyltransferase [Aeromicrobium phragmitis]|uniref:Cysteine methyltransferase n=1 Tax=Aeromicrobium phragmitis TaxID=2478914 RepID=A0A3L8PHB8_9ACTN|nr:MGMT family protein [Aeromicrobium phragmitis]RLV54676.1 cysteine methyltransferase [Aeromicrobium phragmitis]
MNERFTERVLARVEQIPPGQVLTFGLIAEDLGEGGPRQVGQVMSRVGHVVCWWRVVRADGTLPAHLMLEAQEHWAREGTPVRRGRVDVPRAVGGV